MLTDRMYLVLKELNNNKESYVNSNYLAELLSVSSRTIKRDIKELITIVEENGAVIEPSNQGYRLIINDEELYNYYLQTISNDWKISGNKQENIIKLIELILSNKYINQDRLSEELYISRSTISKLISEVKFLLSKYNIILNKKPHYGYFIEGDEISVRNCMVKYLCNSDENNSIILSEYFKGFTKNDCNEILNSLTNIFRNLKIIKTDMEITYITKYLIISIFRVKNDVNINLEGNINLYLDNSIIAAAKSIGDVIIERYGVEFAFEDIIYIAYIIGGNSDEPKELDNTEVFYKKIVTHCLEEINRVYSVNFLKDEVLAKGLVDHLYRSCSRYYLNATLGNPLISMIKSKYIEAYNYSILFSKVFNEECNIKISEEDIGYIALHFAASLERDIMSNNIKIIIVCGSGVGTAELIKSRITKNMPNISVVGVHPAYMLDILDLSSIDLVISTVNIENPNIDKEIINISPLLLNDDIDKINEHIGNQRSYDYLQSLMEEDLFYCNINANTKEQAINFLCEKMIKKNYITDDTARAIMKREEISSTEINELVAIPHCISKIGKKSVIAIGILNKPIIWDKTHVQLIFLGALDPAIQENRKVFTMLYKLTNKIDKVKFLIDSNNLNRFKNRLIK